MRDVVDVLRRDDAFEEANSKQFLIPVRLHASRFRTRQFNPHPPPNVRPFNLSPNSTQTSGAKGWEAGVCVSVAVHHTNPTEAKIQNERDSTKKSENGTKPPSRAPAAGRECLMSPAFSFASLGCKTPAFLWRFPRGGALGTGTSVLASSTH